MRLKIVNLSDKNGRISEVILRAKKVIFDELETTLFWLNNWQWTLAAYNQLIW